MSIETPGQIASHSYHPFSQNHDPSFIRAMQAAYADGYDSALTRPARPLIESLLRIKTLRRHQGKAGRAVVNEPSSVRPSEGNLRVEPPSPEAVRGWARVTEQQIRTETEEMMLIRDLQARVHRLECLVRSYGLKLKEGE